MKIKKNLYVKYGYILLSSMVLPLVNGVTSCKLFHKKDKWHNWNKLYYSWIKLTLITMYKSSFLYIKWNKIQLWKLIPLSPWCCQHKIILLRKMKNIFYVKSGYIHNRDKWHNWSKLYYSCIKLTLITMYKSSFLYIKWNKIQLWKLVCGKPPWKKIFIDM
jgi:hypothetical protein